MRRFGLPLMSPNVMSMVGVLLRVRAETDCPCRGVVLQTFGDVQAVFTPIEMTGASCVSFDRGPTSADVKKQRVAHDREKGLEKEQ